MEQEKRNSLDSALMPIQSPRFFNFKNVTLKLSPAKKITTPRNDKCNDSNARLMMTQSTCAECGSLYFSKVSAMEGLCPNCASHLYGYANCNHLFKDGRCTKCFWDGSVSEFIQNKDL